MKQIARYFQTLLLLLSIVFITKAQNVACFDLVPANATKGCVPFTVTVDASCATNNSGNPPFYNYDFVNNPTNFITATSHTYLAAGKYTIRQIIATGNIFYDIVVEATDPIAPQFTLTSCSGRFVSAFISDVSSPPYDKFIVDFGDGSPTQTVSDGSTVNHVYPTEGSKSVTVTGVYNPNQSCKSLSKSTYTINSIIKPDIIDVKVLKQHITNGSIEFRFNSVTGQRYRIERSSTSSPAFTTIGTPLAGTNAVITYTDANLNTQNDLYTYRIVSFDDCGAGNEKTSDPIQSIRINATANNTLTNSIAWFGSASSLTAYTLKRNNPPQTLSSGTTPNFTDNTIICGNTYCYQTTAALSTSTLAGAAHMSYSIDTCIVAKYTPPSLPPITNLNSTMNGNSTSISWNAPTTGVSSYTLSESRNGTAYKFLSTPTTNSYSYTLPNTDDSYCFQIDYKDLCNNQSLKSSSTCPVIVEGAVLGSTVTLHWNSYSGFDGTGVQSYVVQKLDESGVVISETNVGTATIFSETVNLSDPYINYRIKAIPANNTYQPVFSNNSIFTFEAQIFVPDIFTPNGDGSNEVFKVKAKYVKTYSITIFSRWGEVVYASNSINEGWDGLDRNVYAIEGAYTYKIVATDIHDKEFIQTGTVTLTR